MCRENEIMDDFSMTYLTILPELCILIQAIRTALSTRSGIMRVAASLFG